MVCLLKYFTMKLLERATECPLSLKELIIFASRRGKESEDDREFDAWIQQVLSMT